MEAEYMAKSMAARQIIWLCSLIEELGITNKNPTTLRVDNQGAIDYSESNSTNHSQTKHIDIRHHFIRETILNKQVNITYCPTDDNLADILTKALPKPKHVHISTSLGMTGLRGSVVFEGINPDA